jgi:hypothetical protein
VKKWAVQYFKPFPETDSWLPGHDSAGGCTAYSTPYRPYQRAGGKKGQK